MDAETSKSIYAINVETAFLHVTYRAYEEKHQKASGYLFDLLCFWSYMKPTHDKDYFCISMLYDVMGSCT